MTTAVEGEVARGTRAVLRDKRMADAEDDFRWRSEPELRSRKPLRLSSRYLIPRQIFGV